MDEAKKKEFIEGLKKAVERAESEADGVEELAKELVELAHKKSETPAVMSFALAAALGIGLGFCAKGENSVSGAIIGLLPMIHGIGQSTARKCEAVQEQVEKMAEIKGMAIPVPGVGQA